MNQGKILQFYQTPPPQKVFPRTEKSAVFVPRWRLGSVCLGALCWERFWGLISQLQGKEGTDGLISGWSRVQYRDDRVSSSSHFCFRQSTVGEEWQKLSPLLGPSEPDQMFITMEILLIHHWNVFSEVMGKSNIFSSESEMRMCLRKGILALELGCGSAVLINFTQFLPVLGRSSCPPQTIGLAGTWFGLCVSCRFSSHLGVSHLRTSKVHTESHKTMDFGGWSSFLLSCHPAGKSCLIQKKKKDVSKEDDNFNAI